MRQRRWERGHREVIGRFGIMAGITLSVLFAIALGIAGDPPDYFLAQVLLYSFAVVGMLPIVAGIKYYRDRELDGFIGRRGAVKIGTLMALIAAGIVGFFTYAMSSYIRPDIARSYLEWSRMQEHSLAIDPVAGSVETVNAILPFVDSPLLQAVGAFGAILLLGAIVSFLSGVVLKRLPVQSYEAEQFEQL